MAVDVTFFPSKPAKGESFTNIVIDIVGGSIGVDLIGIDTSESHIVSATDVFVRPAMHIISPACTSLTGILSAPLNLKSFVSRPLSIISPSKFIDLTLSLTFAEPVSYTHLTLPTIYSV